MSAKVAVINLYGVDYRVYGNYVKGEIEERDYPGSPSEFEVEEVEHKGEMIQDVLCALVLEELAEKSREQLDKD